MPDASAVAAGHRGHGREDAARPRVTLVAEIDGKVLGSVEIEIRSLPSSSMIRPVPTAWIGLAVDQERRGEGIGHRLLEAAEAWARERGAGAMMLDMSAANEPARSLYEDSGYALSGLLLRKALEPPGP